MINFYDVNDANRKLHPDAWLGKLLRMPLKVIPKNAVLPILQGPGRGLKWIVRSYNHGCWLGSYEFEKQAVMREIVRPGDVVYDIGAHVGYFSIIFGKLVGAAGSVYAFEPMRENYDFITQHIAINKISNVKAICAGIAASSGMARFATPNHSATYHCTDSGSVQMPVYNLEEYVRDNRLPAPKWISKGKNCMWSLPSLISSFVIGQSCSFQRMIMEVLAFWGSSCPTTDSPSDRCNGHLIRRNEMSLVPPCCSRVCEALHYA